MEKKTKIIKDLQQEVSHQSIIRGLLRWSATNDSTSFYLTLCSYNTLFWTLKIWVFFFLNQFSSESTKTNAVTRCLPVYKCPYLILVVIKRRLWPIMAYFSSFSYSFFCSISHCVTVETSKNISFKQPPPLDSEWSDIYHWHLRQLVKREKKRNVLLANTIAAFLTICGSAIYTVWFIFFLEELKNE